MSNSSRPLEIDVTLAQNLRAAQLGGPSSQASMNHSATYPQLQPNGRTYVMRGDRGFCFICNLELTSPQHCRQHVEGSKHIKKQREAANSTPFQGNAYQANHTQGLGSIPSQNSFQASDNRGPNGEEYNCIGSGGRCFVCSVEFTSAQHASQHLSGQKHLKKVAATRGLLQDTPRLPSSAQVAGSFHQSNISLLSSPISCPNSASARSVTEVSQLVQRMTLSPSPPPRRGPNGEPYIMRGTRGYCYVCELELTSDVHARSHILGQKHIKKCRSYGGSSAPLDGVNLDASDGKVLMCSLCNVPFSCLANAEDHFLSDRHKKKAELIKHEATAPDYSDDPEQTMVMSIWTGDERPAGMSSERRSLGDEQSSGSSSLYSSHYSTALSSQSSITTTSSLGRPGEGQSTIGSLGPQITDDASSQRVHHGESHSESDLGLGQASPCNSDNNTIAPPRPSLQTLSTLSLTRSVNGDVVKRDVSYQRTYSGTNLQDSNHQEASKTESSEKDNLISNCSDLPKVKNKEIGGHALMRQHSQTDSSNEDVSSAGGGYSSIIDNTKQDGGEQAPMQQFKKTGNTENIVSPAEPPSQVRIPSFAMQQIPELEVLPPGQLKQQFSPESPLSHNASPETGITGLVPYHFDGFRGYCRCCSVELTSSQHASQHLNGQRHQKKEAQWKVMQELQNGAMPSPSPSPSPAPLPDVRGNQDDEDKSFYFNGSRGFCQVCKIELTSPQHAQQHIMGKAHKRNKERFGMIQRGTVYPLSCEVCNKSFTGQESAQQHFTSSKHKSKAEMISDSVNTIKVLNDGRVIQKDGQVWYYCDICKVPLNTAEQYEIHKESPKHKKEAENYRARSSCSVAEVQRGVGGLLGMPSQNNGPVSDPVQQSNPESGAAAFYKKETNVTLDHTSALDGSEALRKQALEENQQHLTYGEVRVVNCDSHATVNQSSVNSSAIQEGTYSREVNNPSFPSNSCANTFSGYGRSILGAGAVAPSASRTPHEIHDSSKSHLPTERYGVQTSSTSALSASRSSPLPASSSQYAASTLQGGQWQYGSGFQDSETENNSLGKFGAVGDRWIATYNKSGRGGGSGGDSGGKRENDGRDTRSQSGSLFEEENLRGSSGASGGFGGGIGSSNADRYGGNGSSAGSEAFAGLMTTKPNSVSARRSSAQDRTGRSTLSLDKKEDDDISDDDDDDEDDDELAGRNITEEKIGTGPQMPESEQESSVPKPLKSNKQGFRFFCEECNQHMNTRETYDAHVNGKRHMYNVSMTRAPVRELRTIQKVYPEDIVGEAMNITKHLPRPYQLELLMKAMSGDKIIYLPTGTGKTLVAVLTMGLMLTKNPSRPVLFLVDKVLLVLQQAKYILSQFAGRKFRRSDVHSENKCVDRELLVKPICGGLTTKTNIPVWKHDIVVTTAAYCDNILAKDLIRWEDFSLVVLDEVHHCNNQHPYYKLMSKYHKELPESSRAKILGLTASPAGKDTVEQTYHMLQNLFRNLGGAGIAVVKDRQYDLNIYQSSAEIHPVCVPMSPKEKEFQHHLLEYFVLCYARYANMSSTLKKKDTPPCCYFMEAVMDPTNRQVAGIIAETCMRDPEPLTDIVQEISEAVCLKPDDVAFKIVFDSLRIHLIHLSFVISEIGAGSEGVDELKVQLTPLIEEFEKLGLPSAEMYKRVENFARDGNKVLTMFSKLVETLNDPAYINWSRDSSKALVLVRERKRAKQYAHKLRNNDFIIEKKLRACHIIGHGKGAQNPGMDVRKQKKVLDNKDKYHIFVATSIMEEGVDFSELQLVVCMNPPTSVRALVQMRGRARREGSHFVVLCSSQEEVDKLTKLQRQEENMRKAADICLSEERASGNPPTMS